jgi:hypothetical protein
VRVSGYRGSDDWPKQGVERTQRNPLLSVWWLLLSFGVGIPVVYLVSRFASGGSAEIAGIMAGSVVFNLRAFWNYRVKSWFLPLAAAWALANLSLLIFILMPMHVRESRSLINVIWVEFFSFAGLLWLASRAWGDLPD